MQQLATSWMVYRLTHAPVWLGISMFSSQIPMFVLGLFGGVFVDRMNRHKLLMWTQSLSAIQALTLAILTFSHVINLYELIGLNLVLGTINAIDMPARQTFVVEMIAANREDLPNAIAMNSSVMNGTRLIGPAIAGITIGLFGEGVCFFLNALSYVAVLIALVMMQIEKPKTKISTREIDGKSPGRLPCRFQKRSDPYHSPFVRIHEFVWTALYDAASGDRRAGSGRGSRARSD